MRIAAKYPAAREAQLSRLSEVQEEVADAFARLCEKSGNDDPRPHLLAALTLSTLSTAFRLWFHSGDQDISETVDDVLAALGHLVCDGERTSTAGSSKPATCDRKVRRKRT
jgi:hypothetical protein